MEKKEPEHFGEALRELRDAYGLTQKQMADMLFMARETYGKIENGKTLISCEKFHSYTAEISKKFYKHTGFLMDERFTQDDIYQSAFRIMRRIFGKDT